MSGSSRECFNPSTRRRLLAVLMLWGVALYLASLWVPWLFDDYLYICNNPYIRSLRAVWYEFTGPYTAPNAENNYRPLLMFSFMLNYLWDGLRPMGFHIVNLACHVASGWLLCRLVRQLGASVTVAAVVALLWLAHPAHVHAVTYVAGRSSALVTLWMLLAAVLWTRDGARRTTGSIGWATIACVAALMTKENAVVLPAVLLAYDVITRGRHWRTWWRTHLPIWAVNGLYWWWRFHLFGSVGSAAPPGYLWAAAVRYPSVWIVHVQDVLWPVGLPFLRDASPPLPPLWKAGLVLVVMAAVFVGAWRVRSRAPGVCWGIVWCLTTGLITDLMPLSFPTGVHHLYLISVGMAIALASIWTTWGAAWGRRHRVLTTALVTAVAVWWGVVTVVQNVAWCDEVRLWRREVQLEPSSLRARANLVFATLRHSAGHPEDYAAAEAQTKALLNALLTRKGVRRIDGGAYDVGARDVPFRGRQLQRKEIAELQYFRGQTAMQAGRWAEARASYAEALRIAPGYALPYQALGQLALHQRDDAAAREAFERVARLEPWNAEAYFQLGLLDGRAGHAEALAHFERAIRYDARMAGAYYHLAVTCAALEPPHWAQARRALRRAQALGYAADPRAVRWIEGASTTGP